jgi:hypothetical protein
MFQAKPIKSNEELLEIIDSALLVTAFLNPVARSGFAVYAPLEEVEALASALIFDKPGMMQKARLWMKEGLQYQKRLIGDVEYQALPDAAKDYLNHEPTEEEIEEDIFKTPQQWLPWAYSPYPEVDRGIRETIWSHEQTVRHHDKSLGYELIRIWDSVVSNEAGRYPSKLRKNAEGELDAAIKEETNKLLPWLSLASIQLDTFTDVYSLEVRMAVELRSQSIERAFVYLHDSLHWVSPKGVWQPGNEPGDPGQFVPVQEGEGFEQSLIAKISYEQYLEQSNLTPLEKATAKLLWEDDSPQWLSTELSRQGFKGITPHYASQLKLQVRSKLKKVKPPSF